MTKTIPQNATHTSLDMQNKLIVAVSSVLTEGIKQEIGSSTIKVDGTIDPTGVETFP